MGNCMQEQRPFDWNQSYSGEETDYVEPDQGILDVITDLRPGQALDIGCGAGGLIVALLQRGWQVTGIDIASKAIEAAEKIVQARGFDADLQLADAIQWRPTGLYDLVVSTFALPETKQGRISVFRTIKEALAPGGTILLKDFVSNMKRVGFFAGQNLVTIDELSTAFKELNIIAAEIVDTPVHEHSSNGGDQDEHWSAAFLYAQSHLGTDCSSCGTASRP